MSADAENLVGVMGQAGTTRVLIRDDQSPAPVDTESRGLS